MLKENNKIADSVYSANFDSLIKKFTEILENGGATRKADLEDLKKEATHMIVLTYRQREAIIDRCNNLLSGHYGSTKTAQNMAYGDTAPTSKKEKSDK